MNKISSKLSIKYSVLNFILLAIAFLVTALSISTGSYVSDKENIQIGMVSPKRFIAPKDMVDTAATQKLKDAAINSVGLLYKHDSKIQENAIASINEFFDDVDNILNTATVVDGVLTYNKDAVLKLPVALSDKEYRSYGELTQNGKEGFKNDVITAANYVFDQGITEETMPKAQELVKDNVAQFQWNDDLKNMANLIISGALTPNLVLDEDAMEAAKEKKAEEVSDVMIYKNQKIVDEGEVISERVYQILDQYNLINQDYKDNVIPIIGSIVTVFLLFVAAFFYFVTQQKKLMEKPVEMIILFTVYLLIVLILRLMAELTTFVIIPFTLFAMLVSLLVSTRAALIFNVFVAVIGAFIFNGNMEFLLYFIVTGTFSALFVQYTEKRNHIFLVAIAISFVHIISYLAIGIFFENGYSQELLYQSFYGGIVGLLTVLLSIGSLPFWEGVFDVNTPIKLLELTNPNNELMRRLMIEAPGTYHHCLIVANLAETAAYDIDANPTLARVGAYYHDIGKLKTPLYFGENQAGDNPHDNMDPYDSARVIMDHVKNGRIMAEEAKLPGQVKDFVVQHHGTTFVKYFYYKAAKEYPEGTVKEEDFRYSGPIPQSKETAIVMLADTVEAAVRSTLSNGKDLVQVDDLIKSLIKDKLDDGQLDESMLTIKDLTTIRKAFLKVFQGMYHDRIAYPKSEELAKIRLKETEAKDDASH